MTRDHNGYPRRRYYTGKRNVRWCANGCGKTVHITNEMVKGTRKFVYMCNKCGQKHLTNSNSTKGYRDVLKLNDGG